MTAAGGSAGGVGVTDVPESATPSVPATAGTAPEAGAIGAAGAGSGSDGDGSSGAGTARRSTGAAGVAVLGAELVFAELVFEEASAGAGGGGTRSIDRRCGRPRCHASPAVATAGNCRGGWFARRGRRHGSLGYLHGWLHGASGCDDGADGWLTVFESYTTAVSARRRQLARRVMREQEPSGGSGNRNQERRRRRGQDALRPPGTARNSNVGHRLSSGSTARSLGEFGSASTERFGVDGDRDWRLLRDRRAALSGSGPDREFGIRREVRITARRTEAGQRQARSETRRAATQRPRASRATARWQARADRGARLPPAPARASSRTPASIATAARRTHRSTRLRRMRISKLCHCWVAV